MKFPLIININPKLINLFIKNQNKKNIQIHLIPLILNFHCLMLGKLIKIFLILKNLFKIEESKQISMRIII
jgi:hypothetical protein